MARYANGVGKYRVEVIADADDRLAANGTTVLDFFQAQRVAQARFLDLGAIGSRARAIPPATRSETVWATISQARAPPGGRRRMHAHEQTRSLSRNWATERSRASRQENCAIGCRTWRRSRDDCGQERDSRPDLPRSTRRKQRTFASDKRARTEPLRF